MKTTTEHKLQCAFRQVSKVKWSKMNSKYRVPFCMAQQFLERLCTMCIGEWSQDRRNYKMPWWFKIASKMEFWFRNRETYDAFQLIKSKEYQ